MTLSALNDYVLVQLKALEAGNILLPHETKNPYSETEGTVISAGPDSNIEEGIQVIIPRHGWYRLDGKVMPPIVALRSKDVVARINQEQ